MCTRAHVHTYSHTPEHKKPKSILADWKKAALVYFDHINSLVFVRTTRSRSEGILKVLIASLSLCLVGKWNFIPINLRTKFYPKCKRFGKEKKSHWHLNWSFGRNWTKDPEGQRSQTMTVLLTYDNHEMLYLCCLKTLTFGNFGFWIENTYIFLNRA